MIALGHLLAHAREAIFAKAVEINPILPVGAGLAVDAARIPLMRLADKSCIHSRCYTLSSR